MRSAEPETGHPAWSGLLSRSISGSPHRRAAMFLACNREENPCS